MADAIAGAIVDWRDGDDLTQPMGGAEDPQYAAAGLPYGAKDAPFDTVAELEQVLGMPRTLFERAAEHLTVFSGLPQPDQRFAPIAEGASLSAELRMLALMISGISDSTRLARFLGLSLNTVYTYRTRLKGRALDRENFEEKVRKIYEIPDTKLIFESSDTSDN